MNERQMWTAIRNGMKETGWKYQRLEDKFARGIPDLAFQNHQGTGWMELKYSPKKAAEGKVQTLPHFSVDQRIFLTEWPWTYLFWRVENEWFLFDEGFEILGHVPFSEFEGMCKWHWRGTPGWKTLYSILNCRS